MDHADLAPTAAVAPTVAGAGLRDGRASFMLRALEDGGRVRIIGIDPGLRRAGWGVIALSAGRLSHVANGVCLSGDGALAARLARLHAGLSAAVAAHAPQAAAVEMTFVNADPASALKLGQARGVALLALAQAGLDVAEYAPVEVKKAVVGVGRADKAQVAMMVALLLPGADAASHDAWDALAVAICHAHRAPPPALRLAALR